MAWELLKDVLSQKKSASHIPVYSPTCKRCGRPAPHWIGYHTGSKETWARLCEKHISEAIMIFRALDLNFTSDIK